MCDAFLTEAKDPTYMSPLQPATSTDCHVPMASLAASSSPALQQG